MSSYKIRGSQKKFESTYLQFIHMKRSNFVKKFYFILLNKTEAPSRMN